MHSDVRRAYFYTTKVRLGTKFFAFPLFARENSLFNLTALGTGHFRVPKTLTFKTRRNAKPFFYENKFYLHEY